ncbi:uncharacterized protein METZ01_LOCUS474992, partial [marine metagenome]
MTDGNKNNPEEERLGSGKPPRFISQSIPGVLL